MPLPTQYASPPLPSQEAAIILTCIAAGDFLQLCIRVTMSYLLSCVWLLLFNVRSVRALQCVQQFIPSRCVWNSTIGLCHCLSILPLTDTGVLSRLGALTNGTALKDSGDVFQ